MVEGYYGTEMLNTVIFAGDDFEIAIIVCECIFDKKTVLKELFSIATTFLLQK